jgi:hypothetical protein
VLAFVNPDHRLACRLVNKLFKAAAERDEIWRPQVMALWKQGAVSPCLGELPRWKRWVDVLVRGDFSMHMRDLWRISVEDSVQVYTEHFGGGLYANIRRAAPTYKLWRFMVLLTIVYSRSEHGDLTEDDRDFELLTMLSKASIDVEMEGTMPRRIVLYFNASDRVATVNVDKYVPKFYFNVGPQSVHLREPLDFALGVYRRCLEAGDKGPFCALPLVQDTRRWFQPHAKVRLEEEIASATWFNDID